MCRVRILCSVLALAGLLCSSCGDSSSEATPTPTPLACRVSMTVAGPTAVSSTESPHCAAPGWTPDGPAMIFLIDIGTIEDYPDYPFQLQVGVATPDGAVEASTNTTAFFGVDPNGGGTALQWRSQFDACAVVIDEMVTVMEGDRVYGRNVRLHGNCTKSALPVAGNPDPREVTLNDFALESFVVGWK